MIVVREIDHVVLRVSDLAAMMAFYGDVLGCEIERRQDDIGLVQLRAGRSLIDLVPVDGALGRSGGAAPGKEGRNLDHFCLRVEPFDEAEIRSHLRAHGIDAGPLATRYGAEGEGRLDGPDVEIPEAVGRNTWLPLIGEAGDVALLSPLLLHRSRRAAEPSGRRLLQLECIPADIAAALRLEADGTYTESTDSVALAVAKLDRPGFALLRDDPRPTLRRAD